MESEREWCGGLAGCAPTTERGLDGAVRWSGPATGPKRGAHEPKRCSRAHSTPLLLLVSLSFISSKLFENHRPCHLHFLSNPPLLVADLNLGVIANRERRDMNSSRKLIAERRGIGNLYFSSGITKLLDDQFVTLSVPNPEGNTARVRSRPKVIRSPQISKPIRSSDSPVTWWAELELGCFNLLYVSTNSRGKCG